MFMNFSTKKINNTLSKKISQLNIMDFLANFLKHINIIEGMAGQEKNSIK